MSHETTQDNPYRRLLTRKQAAQVINCSLRFLEVKATQGGGPPYVRVSPKCIRYRIEDLETWIASRIRTNTSDDGVA